MNKIIMALYDEMNEQLQEVSVNNPVQSSVRSYRIVERSLGKLKEIIINHTFNDKMEEINFFKHIMPMFLKELIYYWEVYQIEKWKPPVGKENELGHYMIGAKRMDLYFKLNNEFYAYYQTDSTEYDERYFLRNESGGGEITNISMAIIDSRFSTTYSIEFATIQ
ncbi:MAG TPA: RteC domain-containing protein, partial [Candidatus Babeliaceae bacterium]|nr:RteC domain-containing protein [Candidatus Babeliaceae bacterium]